MTSTKFRIVEDNRMKEDWSGKGQHGVSKTLVM